MGDRAVRWTLTGTGILLLLLGTGSLVVAPLEMICFSWFTPGGRFGYEGFGFGSFMFGNLAVQILGYYLVALLAVPLGYGHCTRKRWLRPVMLGLLWGWWVLGLPLLAVFLFVLFASKTLSVAVGVSVVVVALATYVVLPGVLIRFYTGDSVRHVLERDHPELTWAEALGVPMLVVVGLEVFFVIALHVLLLFNGLFPLLTGWATGLRGLALIDGAVVLLLLLVWGSLRRSRWALWGSLSYFSVMAILWIGTLLSTRWSELLGVLAFPAVERDMLSGMPLQGWHLALLVGLPLVGTLAAVVRALLSDRVLAVS